MGYNVADVLEKFEVTVRRDQRNLRILKADAELGKTIIVACDCADLVSFVHEDPDVPRRHDAYEEGVRRYFLYAWENKLPIVLVPAWAYEFLLYTRRIIEDNIAAHGKQGGFDRFLERYPGARQFYDLWSAGQYDEAEVLYSQAEAGRTGYAGYGGITGWTDIVAFTHDKNVETLLGNPMRRFNAMTTSGRIIGVGEVVGQKGAVKIDEETSRLVLEKLNELRRGESQRRKNETDARALGIVHGANELAGERGRFVSAVTGAIFPLDAFYSAVDEQEAPVSLARSAIYEWVRQNAIRVAGDRYIEYLQMGIALCEELLSQSRKVRADRAGGDSSCGTVPGMRLLEQKRTEGQMMGVFDLYKDAYREPVFREIERCGRRVRNEKYPSLALDAEDAARVLTREKFEASMRRARDQLGKRPAEMAMGAEHLVRDGWSDRIMGQRLDTLYGEIVRDFQRNIY